MDMVVTVMVIQPADTILVTIMPNTTGKIIIGTLTLLMTTIRTPMPIHLTMVGILTPQLEPTLGLTTPIPRLLSPTLLLFIQVEQEEQVAQVEQVEQVEQVVRAVRAVRAAQVERVARVVQVVQVVPAVQEQPEKEAEQVAEVLFS
jgi:hypothetical protein